MGKSPFLFWGFRPPRELLRAQLGTLERQVLEIVAAGDEITVRDTHAQLRGRVAYTTVMTTLDRLFRKGLLARSKRSRAFVYSALATPDEIDGIVASDLVSGLLDGDRSAPLPFLSNLVEAVGEHDRALLDELERLVRLKRRQLSRERGDRRSGDGATETEEP